MIKGFRDFIMRGNVVDLAIAVVVGGAFGKLVDTFVSAIITPLLNAFGTSGSPGFGFAIKGANVAGNPTFLNISTIINAIIVFLLTVLVVYLAIVVPMNKFNERKAAKRAAAGIVDDPEPPTESELLTEIRDLLRGQKSL